MKRREFTAAALAAAGSAMLPRLAAAQEKVHLSFLHKWPEPDNVKFFQNAVAEFERAHPNVSISMDAVADEPYKEKIRVVMASGQIPDIYFTWVGEYTRQFIRAGRVHGHHAVSRRSRNGREGSRRRRSTPIARTASSTACRSTRTPSSWSTTRRCSRRRASPSRRRTWPDFTAALDRIKAAGIVPIAYGSQLAWATVALYRRPQRQAGAAGGARGRLPAQRRRRTSCSPIRAMSMR